MAMESGGRSIHQVPVHDRGSVRNFVRFLQRPENLLTESHCRADFLLRFRSSPSHIAERISCSASEATNHGRGMADKFLLNDPDHWRARAEEARLLAKEMKDSETKDALLRIGDNYEYLAEWVEDWALRRLSKN
jgi:hypothetical protein